MLEGTVVLVNAVAIGVFMVSWAYTAVSWLHCLQASLVLSLQTNTHLLDAWERLIPLYPLGKRIGPAAVAAMWLLFAYFAGLL